MIVEHEIIEQIDEDREGRPLGWVCSVARQHGTAHPLRLLEKMWRAGYVALQEPDGTPIAARRCEEIWRLGHESEAWHVVATDLGRRWVHREPSL